MQEFIVHDRDRIVTFTGEELAHVSSYVNGKRRWIELTLYRTLAGSYVLAGIGRTLIEGEVQRRWAEVTNEPAAIVEYLHLSGRDGGQFLPRTARTLLRDAGARDERIREAYTVRHVA